MFVHFIMSLNLDVPFVYVCVFLSITPRLMLYLSLFVFFRCAFPVYLSRYSLFLTVMYISMHVYYSILAITMFVRMYVSLNFGT